QLSCLPFVSVHASAPPAFYPLSLHDALPIWALWTPFVAFAFAVILGGTTRLRVALQLDQSLAGVLQGMLVLLVLLANGLRQRWRDRKSTRLNSSHVKISYAVFCLKKKTKTTK